MGHESAAQPVQGRRRPGRKPKPDAKNAQINIRMDSNLKAAGDIVLERLGTSASEAVRCLYEYLVREQDLPKELLCSLRDAHVDSWAQHGAGFVWKQYREETGISEGILSAASSEPHGYDELRDQAREKRYQGFASYDQSASQQGVGDADGR